jgi:hypothetical protein
MNLALVLMLAAGCPVPTPVPGTPGLTAVAKVANERAMRENADGKKLYRQEQWAGSRDKYRAALAADPDFLSAELNLACAFSREGRYAEAAAEAAKLIRAAYVPWQREVREAMDLGILQTQEVYRTVTTAMSDSAKNWGEWLGKAAFFLARTKPPVNVTGEGALLLSLNQEVFAWNPESGRYFQVTAEDGHVLGFVRSADRRRVAYLVGGKLFRNQGQADVLRGLSLRVLEIPSMTLGPAVSIPEDVRQVELSFAASPEILVRGPSGHEAAFRMGESWLEKIPNLRRGPSIDFLLLTTAGVRPVASRNKRPGCPFELVSKTGPDGVWQVEARGGSGNTFILDTRYGAGLPGLPFPDGSAHEKSAKESAKSSKHDNK